MHNLAGLRRKLERCALKLIWCCALKFSLINFRVEDSLIFMCAAHGELSELSERWTQWTHLTHLIHLTHLTHLTQGRGKWGKERVA